MNFLADTLPYAPHNATQAQFSLGTLILLILGLFCVCTKSGGFGTKLIGGLLIAGALGLFSHSHPATSTPTHRAPTVVTTPHRSSSGTGHKQPAPKQSCLLICGVTTTH